MQNVVLITTKLLATALKDLLEIRIPTVTNVCLNIKHYECFIKYNTYNINLFLIPALDTSPECKSDSECASQLACINQRCQNPCVTSNPCSSTAECTTLQHRPTCSCPQGWAGDPQSHCYKRKYHTYYYPHRFIYFFFNSHLF